MKQIHNFSLLFLLLSTSLVPLFGQKQNETSAKLERINAIRNDARYCTGWATGTTEQEAVKSAYSELATNISVSIQTLSEGKATGVSQAEGIKVKREILDKVNISSYITNLRDVRKIVVEKGRGNHMEYQVLCYVSYESLKQMFKEQESMIVDYIREGQNKEFDKEIGYAISNYYKAYVLLLTSPQIYSIIYTDNADVPHVAVNYVNERLEDIFRHISVEATDISQENKAVTLCFKYNNQMISGHLLFDYYDMFENFENRQANNSYASLNFNDIPETLDITIGYHDLSNVHDNTIRNAMLTIGKQVFLNTTKRVKISQSKTAMRQSNKPSQDFTDQRQLYTQHAAKFTPTDNKKYHAVLEQIEKAINTHQYTSVQSLFTVDGYHRWETLVGSGKATIIGKPEYRFLTLDETTYCRGMKVQLNYTNNFRPIVEDVCFRFNKDYKIQSLSFCLSRSAEGNILSDSKQWGDTAKLLLLSFLEDYKTAYSLKDINWLEKVFSNDALIITGTVLKTKTLADTKVPQLGNQQKTIYKIKSKTEYIADLQQNFKQKRWVNIIFEDVDVHRRVRDNSDCYGIQLKQNYFSDNYCDEGYLSLFVEMTPEGPVIYVRVWQQDKVNELSAKTIAENPGLILQLGK